MRQMVVVTVKGKMGGRGLKAEEEEEKEEEEGKGEEKPLYGWFCRKTDHENGSQTHLITQNSTFHKGKPSPVSIIAGHRTASIVS